MSTDITNIKLGSGTSAFKFSQCNKIIYTDVNKNELTASAAYYAINTTGSDAIKFWEPSSENITQVLYDKSDIYGNATNAATILYSPSVDTTFNTITIKSANLPSYMGNFITTVALLTSNGDGTYTISSWLYSAESGENLTETETGDYIDDVEIYNVCSTYNSDDILNSWDGIFKSGNYYMVCLCSAYEDQSFVSGNYPILTGLYGYQLYQQTTGSTLTKDDTYQLYLNIV